MAFRWWLVNDSTTTEIIQAGCVAASYRTYRAKSLGRTWQGNDFGVSHGFTNIFLLQHAGYLQKSVALNLFPESMYLSRTQSTLIRCWERDSSNSQAVGKDKHRPIDRSRSKEKSCLELWWHVIAAKATWIGRMFQWRYWYWLASLMFSVVGYIAFELRPFCELHAAVSKPQRELAR